jgi:transcription elongation factor Elf1
MNNNNQTSPQTKQLELRCARCGAELAVIKAASAHTMRLICDACRRETRFYEKQLTAERLANKVTSFS